MNGYQDITEQYAAAPRIELGPEGLFGSLRISELFKDPKGRVFVPTAGSEKVNLFVVEYSDIDSFGLVAQFSNLADAEEFLEAAASAGRTVYGKRELRKLYEPVFLDNVCITKKYASFQRVELSTLENDGHLLFIARLQKNWEGHILIPEMNEGANLFAVLAATDKLTLVAEFWESEEAARFPLEINVDDLADLVPELDNLASCQSDNFNEEEFIRCVLDHMPKKQSAILACFNNQADGGAAKCLAEQAGNKRVVDLLSCVDGSPLNLQDLLNCGGSKLVDQEKQAQLQACLALDEKASALCMFENAPKAKDAYGCLLATEDRNNWEHCAAMIKDPQVRRAVSCISESSNDSAQMAACAASSFLPPEAAHLAQCAGSAQGTVDFAVCAVGPKMNEEWRIAAECAVQSGGNPAGFAGCTATRLTIRELTKCFKGRVGKDCFGPNNTIIKTLNNTYNDVAHGPGKNNEVRKFFRNAFGW